MNYKTIALSVIALMLCTLMRAQENQTILTQIKKGNATITSIEGKFAQTKIIAANGKEIKSEGTIYLSDSDKMAMHYDAPSTDLLIINGNRFYMIRGKKKNNFNTEKNKAMRSLRNTLLYCLHGQPALLAKENSAEIAVKQEGTSTIVTLTSQKKTPRGYEKIILHYNTQSFILSRMEMVEWGGNSTIYEMSNLKTNGNIDTVVYTIPEK